MRDPSKPVSFRLETHEWNELVRRAESVKQSPGGYARTVLFRELQGDTETQLEGVRDELAVLETAIAVVGQKLTRLNSHLRKTLTALLVELTQAKDVAAAEDLALALVPTLETKKDA